MKNIIYIGFFTFVSLVISTRAGLTKRFLITDIIEHFNPPVDDFSESRKGYEFVYHDDHNLLLVLTNETCLFVNSLDYDRWSLGSHQKNQTEDWLINHVIRNGTLVKNTTLDLMRTKYSDVLANYRCNGKTIYEFDIHEKVAASGADWESQDICKWTPWWQGCQHQDHQSPSPSPSHRRHGSKHHESDD